MRAHPDRRGWYGTFSRLIFLLLVFLSSCAPGGVSVNIVIPPDGEDIRHLVTELRVEAIYDDGTIIEEVSERISNINLPDIQNGTLSFFITATDEDGHELFRGRSVPITVTREAEITTWVVLAPVERISRLPVAGRNVDVQDITDRCDLEAIRVGETPDRPEILISGGRTGDVPRTEAWIYRPDRLTFDRTGSMSCARAGHNAILTTRDERKVVLIAGGGDETCPTGEGSAADTLEIYDIENGWFTPLEFAWIDDDVVLLQNPPDLSEADLASLGDSLVLLVVSGESWILDLTQGIATQSDPPSSDESSLLAATVDGQGVAVLTDSDNEQWLDILESQGDCDIELVTSDKRLRIDGLAASGNTLSALRYGGILVTSGAKWWAYDTSECRLDPSHTRGDLEPLRSGHTATTLSDSDGRVLIVGGGSTTTSLFLPRSSRGNPSPTIRAGPTSGHSGSGHAAVLMADESVLILGCGAEPEVFNPRPNENNPMWQEVTGIFNPESRPQDSSTLRVVMAIDASKNGAHIREKSMEYAISMVNPEWEEAVEIGVIATDLVSVDVEDSCQKNLPYYPHWTVESAASPIFVDASERDRIADRISFIHDNLSYGDRCAVQQPLLLSAIMGGMADFYTPNNLYQEVSAHTGPVLFVAQMGGDDRSMHDRCDPESESPGVECDPDEEWMLHPALLSNQIHSRGRIQNGYEIILLYDDGLGENCPIPNRLASFGENLSCLDEWHGEEQEGCDLGVGHGLFRSACNPSSEELGEILLSRVRMWAFRQACVRREVTTSESMTCQVSMTYFEGNDRSVEFLEEGQDWTPSFETTGCCRDDGTNTCVEEDYALITINPEYTIPGTRDFERFEYVCW